MKKHPERRRKNRVEQDAAQRVSQNHTPPAGMPHAVSADRPALNKVTGGNEENACMANSRSGGAEKVRGTSDERCCMVRSRPDNAL